MKTVRCDFCGEPIEEGNEGDSALLAWNENDNGDLGAVVGVTVETDDAVEPE